MRRLFSSFADGWPGVGLLIMRLAAAAALIAHFVATLRTHPSFGTALFDVFGAILGALLIAGVWTPIVGAFVAVLGIVSAIAQPGDPSAAMLLATIGAALALLGPGAWSVDAHLFGWRRIVSSPTNPPKR